MGTGPTIDTLWSTRRFPPELPVPRRTSDSGLLDFDLRQETTKWLIVTFPADFALPEHRTDSLTYVVVLAGDAVLELEVEEIKLDVGDSVLFPGVMHGWRFGATGCTISSVSFPLSPLDSNS